MKFGKEIQSKQIPGWSQYYLDYKALKKIVSSLSKKHDSAVELDTPSELAGSPIVTSEIPPEPHPPRILWGSNAPRSSDPQPVAIPITVTSLSDNERGPVYQKHKALFFFKLERELEKINSFYLQKEAELKLRLDTLLSKRKSAALHVAPTGTPDAVADHVEWRAIEEGFLLLQKDLIKLQQFIEINAIGFRKILKKWDKRSTSTTKELYLARQVDVQPVFDRKLITELADVVSTCLRDLTNVSIGPETGISSANEMIVSQQLAMETSAQMHPFHDLERSIHRALSSEDAEALKECIALADRLAKQPSGRTHVTRVLWKAAIEAEVPLADLIMFSPPFDFKFIDDINGRTCLHSAAIAGEARLIALCLEHGVQFDRQDVYGRNALHYAAMHGHEEICQVLLDRGISALGVDLDNFTPLLYAITAGHVSCVSVLIGYHDPVDFTNSELNPLSLASRYGHQAVVLLLLEAGVQCEPNSNGEYPMHLAAQTGHADVCSTLVNYPGSDLPDKYNEWTPLFHAARFGHLQCVRVLLDARARTEAVDESKRSPSFYAAWFGHLDVLTSLLHDVGGSRTDNSLKRMSVSPPSDVVNSLEEELDMIPSLSLPPPIMPFRVYGHNYLAGTHLIQISLNEISTSHAKHSVSLPPVHLLPHVTGSLRDQSIDIVPPMKLVVTCKTEAITAPFALKLPIEDHPDIIFQVSSLEDFFLEFTLYPSFGSKIIGRTTLLPAAFRGIKVRGRYVAPLLDHHLHVIGEIAFEVCVVSPFDRIKLEIGGAIETYWKSAATPFTASSKLGNSAPKSITTTPGPHSPGSRLLLPSSTESTISSSSLTGEYVRIVVQLTRDLVPVIYPAWHISIGGINVGISDISAEQFIGLSPGGTQPPPANGAIDAWASFMQTSLVTLEQTLTALPLSIGLFIEIVCATSAMRDKLLLGHTHKLNVIVDTVLDAVYAIAPSSNGAASTPMRKIIFSSRHPDVCSAVNWKQPNYPVIYSTPCGASASDSDFNSMDYPEQDRRSSSISAGLNFVKSSNIVGMAVPVQLLLQVPSLVSGIKENGAMLAGIGSSLDLKLLDECLEKASSIGLDGVLIDNIVSFYDAPQRA